VLLHRRGFGLHGLARIRFLPRGFATRFAFPPRCFVACLRFGTHLGPVHFPLPLAQFLDVGSLRQERGHFACAVFLLERIRRQTGELRPRRRLVGTPLAMAIAPTTPAAALLVTFAACRLRPFADARRLWLPLLRLPLLRLRWTLLPLRALLLRSTLAARTLVTLLLPAVALVRPALAALLRAALAAAVLVARAVAPLIAALAAVARLGAPLPALLRLLLATRLARRS